MASCQTSQWVSTSPYVKLTVTASNTSDTVTTLSWTLQYIASSAADTSVKKAYKVWFGAQNQLVAEGSYDINGKTGTKTITSGTKTITRTHSAQTIIFGFKFDFNLTWSEVYSGSRASQGTISVPAKTKYTVSYDGNGGSGAPTNQTKWHGETLKLSTTTPTRTGYTFRGWGVDGTNVAYSAGANYTPNNSVKLYAVWQAITYTVSYDANGGSGAPSSQTKTYGVNLTLSSITPTRSNYEFLGWSTYSATTSASYKPGATYTSNANLTLYAVWRYAYKKPRIYNLTVSRCTSTGSISDSGTYCTVSFDWDTDNTAINYVLSYKSSSSSSFGNSETVSLSGTSGSVSGKIYGGGVFNAESSYDIQVSLSDGSGSTYMSTASATLPSMRFPIDFLAGGTGVAFGKTAEIEDLAEFEFDAQFNGAVYGKALGMDRVTLIPSYSDFNDYIDPGCYAVYSNSVAENIENIPVARAGRLEVWSSTGEGVRTEQWSYIRQRFIPYNSDNAVWERDITRGENNSWTFYDWWRSSLTPALSRQVYEKGNITAVRTSNFTVGTAGSYIQMPFTGSISSTNFSLTTSNGSVNIKADIQRVMASGQALVQCRSSIGNRFLKIVRTRGTTTTAYAWTCVTGSPDTNLLLSLSPITIPVQKDDIISMQIYTNSTADVVASGSATNGYQTYLTVVEL